jgi:hypothetical protein
MVLTWCRYGAAEVFKVYGCCARALEDAAVAQAQATLAPEDLPDPPEHKTLVELGRVVVCVGEELGAQGLGDVFADLEALRVRYEGKGGRRDPRLQVVAEEVLRACFPLLRSLEVQARTMKANKNHVNPCAF